MAAQVRTWAQQQSTFIIITIIIKKWNK
jgi:hypothetical protein